MISVVTFIIVSPMNNVVRSTCMVAQSCPTLCDPVDCSPLGSLVHGFFRQEYWSGLPLPPLRDLPQPGIESTSPVSPALAGVFFTARKPHSKKNNFLNRLYALCREALL